VGTNKHPLIFTVNCFLHLDYLMSKQLSLYWASIKLLNMIHIHIFAIYYHLDGNVIGSSVSLSEPKFF